jgi:two-component system NtrC family response regulator
VSASSQDLDQLIATGQFRADLAFRIQGLLVHVPSLSERTSDISLLARHFLSAASTELGIPASLDDEATALLSSLQWPGNVRELRQVVGRARALSRSQVIGAGDIRRAIAGWDRKPNGVPVAPDMSAERQQLIDVLARHDGDTAAVATELKVSRKTVYDRMNRFGIEMPRRYHRRNAPDSTPEAPI